MNIHNSTLGNYYDLPKKYSIIVDRVENGYVLCIGYDSSRYDPIKYIATEDNLHEVLTKVVKKEKELHNEAMNFWKEKEEKTSQGYEWSKKKEEKSGKESK